MYASEGMLDDLDGGCGGGGVHAYRHLLGNREALERFCAGAEVHVIQIGGAAVAGQLGRSGVDGDDFTGVRNMDDSAGE